MTHTVPAGTTVTVTVTCTTSTSTATADAQFTAEVEISGLDHASATPDTDSTSAEVSDTFTITPTAARCSAQATPGTPQVAPATGASRTVTLDVAAGTTVWVIVICNHHTNRDLAATRFTAHPAPTNTDTDTTPPAATPTPPTTTTPTANSDDCDTPLGALTAATPPTTGTLAATDGCTSTRHPRKTATSTYQARRHTFTLNSPGWVTITLESAATNTQRIDTYLVLLRGHTPDGTGTYITHNDDHRSGYGTHGLNSRLVDVFLQPGDYTIETTTYHAHSTNNPTRTTGDYDLTVEATLTGLQASYDATVGRELRIDFETGDFTPTASVPVSGLAASATKSGPAASLSVTPSRTGAFSVTLSFSRLSGASDRGTRSTRSATPRAAAAASYVVTVDSTCPAGQVPGPHPNGTCIWDTDENLAAIEIGDQTRGSQLYEVTPALLEGAKRVAVQALAENSGCGMRTGQLAAVMIAIGYWEYPIEVGGANQRVPARSLMTLSRSSHDRDPPLYPENVFSETVDVGAFWHPGVGYWQLDWWPVGMNHAERADIDEGGHAVATKLAGAYCSPWPGETPEQSLKNFLDAKTMRGGWSGCKGATTGDDQCYETFQKMYLGVESFSGAERLWVTTAQNSGDDHARGGGVHDMSCRFGSGGTDFPCWLYDTESASIEGAFSGGNKRGITGGDSPLAAPFMSFTHGPEASMKRFAVFPQSFAYPAGATGTKITWIKVVPTGARVRNTAASSWHEDDYDEDDDDSNNDNELHANICELHITGVPDRCERLSTTSPLFATTVRKAYPGQSPGDGR
ncbi:DVUA0089 family protein [Candidatus Poriferisodalis sp.]|uniref:DVUA0089 family protein n=1 Tax=Candidatus Poriferisodalis sp. TaxID=3101277 RepID=UPI003AF420A8